MLLVVFFVFEYWRISRPLGGGASVRQILLPNRKCMIMSAYENKNNPPPKCYRQVGPAPEQKSNLKILGPKKFWVRKNIKSTNFLVKKICWSKNFVNMTWPVITCLYLSKLDYSCPDLIWINPYWLYLSWPDFIGPDLTWPVLTWLDLS